MLLTILLSNMHENRMVFNDFGEDWIVHFLRIQKLGFPEQNRGSSVWDVCIGCPSKCASYSEQIRMNFVLFLLAKGNQIQIQNKLAQE